MFVNIQQPLRPILSILRATRVNERESTLDLELNINFP